MTLDGPAFIDALQAYATNPDRVIGERVEWVNGGIDDDGAVVVLYKVAGSPSIYGRRYVLEAFAAMFSPGTTIAELAWTAFVDEMSDPSGEGILRDVGWARSLVGDADQVHWHS